MNVLEKIKTTQKEQTENSDASSKKFEVGIEKVNHDAVETSSKNLKVSLKCSTQSTSDTTTPCDRHVG